MDEDVKIEMGDVGESQDWMAEAQRKHRKRGVNFVRKYSTFRLSPFHFQVDEVGEEEREGRRRKQGVVYLKQLSRNSISEMRM